MIDSTVSAESGRPLRLLYLVHQFFPQTYLGTEKFVFQMAQTMQRRGHQTQVVTYTRQQAGRLARWLDLRLLTEQYSYQGVSVLAQRHLPRPRAIYQIIVSYLQRQFASQYLRRWRPDLVHIGHPMRSAGFIQAAHELNIPTLLTLTDYWLVCPRITLVDQQGMNCSGPMGGAACQRRCPHLTKGYVRKHLKRAGEMLGWMETVATPTRFLAQKLQKEFPALNPHFIPHGVNPVAAHRLPVSAGRGMVFAYTGSLSGHKGVGRLLDAFMGLSDSRARLLIYGSGPDESALRAQARTDNRITFCGAYDPASLGDVFQGMDVLVVPSTWYENHPFVVAEALAAGVPVLASDIGGLPEMIQPGLNGWLTPPGDVIALRRHLQKLIDQPETIAALKREMRAHPTWSLENEADQYEALYRELLASQPSKGMENPCE